MRRLPPALLAVLVLGASATALAQSGDEDPYRVPEPEVRSAAVLRFTPAVRCLRGTRVTVRLLPPLGAVFGVVRVTVDGRQAVRLTGIPRAASATLSLPRGRTRVAVRGTTLGGQTVRAARTYRTCPPRRTPAPPTGGPQRSGGGD
jgi:hypothetical protein